MDRYVGKYKLGDRVLINYDGKQIEGVIESFTTHQAVIKPDMKNSRFYDGFRICIPHNEILANLSIIEKKVEPNHDQYGIDEDGNLTF